ncbi:hypothetical protein CDAR_373761 [Caerostris darwini]|uniref:Uncharacterized protein n=1 Tax=Caerostris darwini TaxID=1538125 RepID=A0AAV4QN68_9ARAC|nr:hypothetical protein CDAR_373761 [Caerostris darwini]
MILDSIFFSTIFSYLVYIKPSSIHLHEERKKRTIVTGRPHKNKIIIMASRFLNCEKVVKVQFVFCRNVFSEEEDTCAIVPNTEWNSSGSVCFIVVIPEVRDGALQTTL